MVNKDFRDVYKIYTNKKTDIYRYIYNQIWRCSRCKDDRNTAQCSRVKIQLIDAGIKRYSGARLLFDGIDQQTDKCDQLVSTFTRFCRRRDCRSA